MTPHPVPRRARRPALLALLAALVPPALLLAGCAALPGSPGGSGTADAGTTPVASGATYVAVGDSYAAGYQPEGFSQDEGFADQLVRRLAGTPQALQLVDLACPGATSASVLDEPGCSQQPDAPGAVAHPGATQLAALERELSAHAGRVRLVTVVLGGNDVLPCFERADPEGCVRAALPGLTSRLATVLAAVRRLAPDAPVVGLTYPDVFLGLLVTGSAADARRAEQSVAIFRDLLNPALQRTYDAAGARFVDVTARSGAYDPLTPTTTLQGRAVPASVVTVCEFTHFCESGDIHPNDAGYAWYADRVLEAVPGLAPTTSATTSTTTSATTSTSTGG